MITGFLSEGSVTESSHPDKHFLTNLSSFSRLGSVLPILLVWKMILPRSIVTNHDFQPTRMEMEDI